MLQVAAYCRVSTDKEDQANSFEAQQRYFREYIQRQPDWELQGIYADEGFSGTSPASCGGAASACCFSMTAWIPEPTMGSCG